MFVIRKYSHKIILIIVFSSWLYVVIDSLLVVRSKPPPTSCQHAHQEDVGAGSGLFRGICIFDPDGLYLNRDASGGGRYLRGGVYE